MTRIKTVEFKKEMQTEDTKFPFTAFELAAYFLRKLETEKL